MKKLILSLISLLGLIACQVGTDTINSTQTGTKSTSYNNDTLTINYTATGCLALSQSSSCNITITYYSNINSIFNGALTQNLPSGFSSSDFVSCPSVTTSHQTCKYSIKNVNSTNTSSQIVSMYANGQESNSLSLFSLSSNG